MKNMSSAADQIICLQLHKKNLLKAFSLDIRETERGDFDFIRDLAQGNLS